MSKLEDVILRDTRANQPLVTDVAKGTIFFVTDEFLLERSSGIAWETYSAGSGVLGISTLTGDVTAGPGSGSQAATIGNDKVTYAKLQNISATARVLARKTAGSGDVEEATLSEILDFIASAAQGDILYRGATEWARLAAGTSGQFLKSQGAGANPIWASISSSPLIQTTQVLTNAQILTLNSAPVSHIAAPGSNKANVLLATSMDLNKTAGAYGVSSAGINFVYVGTTTGIFTSFLNPSWANTTGNFYYASNLTTQNLSGPGILSTAHNVAIAIRLSGAADLTGGHADNSLKVTTLHFVVDLIP